jgi:hypothetical protein
MSRLSRARRAFRDRLRPRLQARRSRYRRDRNADEPWIVSLGRQNTTPTSTVRLGSRRCAPSTLMCAAALLLGGRPCARTDEARDSSRWKTLYSHCRVPEMGAGGYCTRTAAQSRSGMDIGCGGSRHSPGWDVDLSPFWNPLRQRPDALYGSSGFDLQIRDSGAAACLLLQRSPNR